ncbi:MAG: serine protease [Anaerolineales bacterium]
MSPRKGSAFLLLALVSLLLAACGSAPTPTATAVPPTEAPSATPTQSAFANVSVPFEAVVQIWALYYDENGESQLGWTGSGTIISPDGYILSNAHVVLPDRYFPVDELVVALTVSQDQEPVPSFYAEVLQADATLDIAVLRVTHDYDGVEVDRAALHLPFVPLGNSDQLNLGDAVTILGYPGIGGDTVTLTRGEVSGFTSQPDYGQRAFIKTSATIAGGNSGGLAADADGNLIGIPTQLGYGGDDQYVDCRVLADTNRDGFVDDGDSCVPTGGFINALRPLTLALPLIEAAQRGEVSIIGVPEPEVADVPAASGTFTDDFSNENSGWDIYETDTSTAFYSDGEYYVGHIGGGPSLVAEPYLNFDNVDLSVDFRFDQSENAEDVTEVNLVCRYSDLYNYYEFRILNDGRVGIAKWLGSEYIMLLELQPTGAVYGDSMHQANITCDGNYLGLSVDGQTVAETFDDTFVSGDVGLGAYAHADGAAFLAAFDNFSSTALGSAQAGVGAPALFDDFSDPASGWVNEADRYYLNGRYFMEINPPNSGTADFLVQDFADVVISVDVNIERAAGDGDIGILCRFVDANNFYALEVSEDGYYTIWKVVNGEKVYLVEWTPSDLIPTDGSPFVLLAACGGSQLSVGIDGELLATVTDTDLSFGYIGLTAGTYNLGGLIVSFDNFEVIEY